MTDRHTQTIAAENDETRGAPDHAGHVVSDVDGSGPCGRCDEPECPTHCHGIDSSDDHGAEIQASYVAHGVTP